MKPLSEQAKNYADVYFYEQQQSVEVSVDGLLFADGTFRGADSKGWRTRWMAWIDAEREIVSTLSTATDESNLRTMLNELDNKATEATPNPKSVVKIGMSKTAQYAYAASKAPTYTVAYQSAQMYFVSRVSGLLQSQGAKATISFIGRLASSKVYPTVHR